MRIRRSDVSHGREQHGIKAELVHPLFQIQLTRFLQTAQTIRYACDLVVRFEATFGHIDILLHTRREIAFAVRERAQIVWEYKGTVGIRQFVKFRITVGAQEFVKSPARQFP